MFVLEHSILQLGHISLLQCLKYFHQATLLVLSCKYLGA